MQERLAHTVPQACERANLGRSKLYEEIKAGRLKVVKIGRKTLITEDTLRAYLRQMETTR